MPFPSPTAIRPPSSHPRTDFPGGFYSALMYVKALCAYYVRFISFHPTIFISRREIETFLANKHDETYSRVREGFLSEVLPPLRVFPNSVSKSWISNNQIAATVRIVCRIKREGCDRIRTFGSFFSHRTYPFLQCVCVFLGFCCDAKSHFRAANANRLLGDVIFEKCSRYPTNSGENLFWRLRSILFAKVRMR